MTQVRASHFLGRRLFVEVMTCVSKQRQKLIPSGSLGTPQLLFFELPDLEPLALALIHSALVASSRISRRCSADRARSGVVGLCLGAPGPGPVAPGPVRELSCRIQLPDLVCQAPGQARPATSRPNPGLPGILPDFPGQARKHPCKVALAALLGGAFQPCSPSPPGVELRDQGLAPQINQSVIFER